MLSADQYLNLLPARQQHSQLERRSRPAAMPCLLTVKAQGLHHRRVAETEQEGRAVASVDVLVEGPRRHREHVLVFPVQPPAPYNRVASALDHVIVRAAD